MTENEFEIPLESRILEEARREPDGLSIREAARRSGISDTRWRQITAGFQHVGGSKVPVRAPADTLARMAAAVGLGSEELVAAGRDDAAEALAKMGRGEPDEERLGHRIREGLSRMESVTERLQGFSTLDLLREIEHRFQVLHTSESGLQRTVERQWEAFESELRNVYRSKPRAVGRPVMDPLTPEERDAAGIPRDVPLAAYKADSKGQALREQQDRDAETEGL